MLINGEDLIAGVGLTFAFLELTPKLRGKVIEYLKACEHDGVDEEEVFHKLTKYTKCMFYESDIEKGYELIFAGIRQAIGEPAPDLEEVKPE